MRVIKGEVKSTKMDKTAVVVSSARKQHSKYKKIYTRSKSFYVNDPENTLKEGQTVLIEETSPQSKLKKWKIKEVLS